MSINWVMLDGAHHFVPLPREKTLFTSPPRTALVLETGNPYPGKEPVAINCASGTAYLTNQRLIYLPADPTPNFQSFSAPILNLQDTHASAPFFGSNVWYAVLQPVSGGGIPAHHAFVKLKMTFKEGGAFDFSSTYERIKETLCQAADTARESGHPVDLSEVDLEQLPAYEEVADTTSATIPQPQIHQPTPISANNASHPTQTSAPSTSLSRNPQVAADRLPPPDEPPPDYEETQQNTIANSLEESIRRSQ